jgi:di/tricarboxylate transporter
MNDALLLLLVLAGAMVGFITGVVRYDLVALLALLATVLLGLVPAAEAFTGFGHPAVITVAAVLVISRGLQEAGIVNVLGRVLARIGQSTTVQVAALTLLVALLSAFMNNVGALALLLPVAMTMARNAGTPPSRLLMPLAFGSLLGGLCTLIGTPPNVIIAGYRAQQMGESFGMFSFAPVGVAVAAAAGLFIALIGWRLLPERKGQGGVGEMFEVEKYLSELRVGEKAKAVGQTLGELNETVGDSLPLVAVVREGRKYPPSRFFGPLAPGDVLLVEAEAEEIEAISQQTGFEIGSAGEEAAKLFKDSEVRLVEAVVQPEGFLAGRSAGSVRLLSRYGLRLLAVARQGKRLRQRLRDVRFAPGDVLLLQGDEDDLSENLARAGCLPLASRALQVGQPRGLLVAVGLFAAGIIAIVAGGVAAPVALTAVAVALLAARVLALREAYQAIEWPVIVLLGALVPVGAAFETTGGAALLSDAILRWGADLPPLATLAVLLVATMVLSDIINNAAAAVLMAPIGYTLARGLEVSADPFLMAVAIGASCAFLTPIGHQSNTLVMGPGGYQFGDYWRMGLPVQAVVFAVALVALPVVFPF